MRWLIACLLLGDVMPCGQRRPDFPPASAPAWAQSFAGEFAQDGAGVLRGVAYLAQAHAARPGAAPELRARENLANEIVRFTYYSVIQCGCSLRWSPDLQRQVEAVARAASAERPVARRWQFPAEDGEAAAVEIAESDWVARLTALDAFRSKKAELERAADAVFAERMRR